MASSAAALAAAVGAYASRRRVLDDDEYIRRYPPVYSDGRPVPTPRVVTRLVTCAYCGRRRSELLATASCKGCGAQEITR